MKSKRKEREKVNKREKLMKDEGYSAKFMMHLSSVAWWESPFVSSDRVWVVFRNWMLCPIFRHLMGRKETFLFLQFLNYFQLEIILVPVWYILWWNILIPNNVMTGFSFTNSIKLCTIWRPFSKMRFFPPLWAWALA